MTVQDDGASALDYHPCRYGRSRVTFRGPKKLLAGDYVAFLGGSETYGRFVPLPFPALLEQHLQQICVNFGVMNAGLDLYLGDPVLIDMVNNARVAVVQMMGAQNMSNRFYMVHPRRNDRFLRASEKLQNLYPEIDFTEFHFNRHMLTALADTSPERFQKVVDELRLAWVARMRTFISGVNGQVVLLWLADHPPRAARDIEIASNPLFVTPDMIEDVRGDVAEVVELVVSKAAQQGDTRGMVFSAFETNVAEELLGVLAHEEAADALEPVLRNLLTQPEP